MSDYTKEAILAAWQSGLDGRDATAAEIHEAVTVSKNTVQVALKEMAEDGLISRYKNGGPAYIYHLETPPTSPTEAAGSVSVTVHGGEPPASTAANPAPSA